MVPLAMVRLATVRLATVRLATVPLATVPPARPVGGAPVGERLASAELGPQVAVGGSGGGESGWVAAVGAVGMSRCRDAAPGASDIVIGQVGAGG
jgi:hypothetical protein